MDVLILYTYAYLAGAIPTAYLIGRFVKGIDIRDYGSGNVGGTNLFVHVGKWWTIPLGVVELPGLYPKIVSVPVSLPSQGGIKSVAIA